MKKRIISLIALFALIMTFSSVINTEVKGYDESAYWAALADYTSAVSSGSFADLKSAVKKLENIFGDPTDATEIQRLVFPLQKLAQWAEEQGYYDIGYEYYGKAKRFFEKLMKNDESYYEYVHGIEAIMRRLRGYFEVYVEAEHPASYPFYNAINEPELGTYSGYCDDSSAPKSASLIYVHFMNGDISDYEWIFPEDENEIIEIAWNTTETKDALDEGLTEKGKEYIKRNVEFLATVKNPILLRFGAEVNVWTTVATRDQAKAVSESFIKLFRYIADEVHKYADKVAMVYSPNCVSGWYTSPKQFYPGDKYVDWIGMSLYGNVYSGDEKKPGSAGDAWKGKNFYENILITAQEVIEAFPDKPVMISECGFKYTGEREVDDFAIKNLKYAYTYLNRVYPQIKAIFYFNTDFNGNKYTLDNNALILDTYTDMQTSNVSIAATMADEGETKRYYTELSKFNESATGLKISAYGYYPAETIEVSYQLDGKEVFKSTTYPYEYELKGLEEGIHTFKAVMKAGKMTLMKEYGIYADPSGTISTLVSSMKDVGSSYWGYRNIAYALSRGLFSGTSETTFSPEIKMTRGMLVAVLYRLTGRPDVAGMTDPFTDVNPAQYYADAVKWAYNNDIVHGMTETTFAPDTDITREQVAKILFNYAAALGYDTENSVDITKKPDYDAISDWARDAIAWAGYYQIIQGDDRGYINPKNGAKRVEVATMLRGFITKLMEADPTRA